MGEQVDNIAEAFKFDFKTCNRVNVNEILGMSEEQLSILTKEDCNQLGWDLLNHSLFVQCLVNKKVAEKKWLQSQLLKEISKNISTGGRMRWEIAEQQAINDNEYASDLKSKITECEMYESIGNNVARILGEMSRKLEGFKYNGRS